MEGEKFMEETEYKSDVEIDRDSLEGEWEKQAGLYMHYALKHADAIQERDSVQENIGTCEADLDQQIRQEVLEKGEKTTEKAIANRIKVNKEMVALNEKLIKANHKINVIQSVVRSLEHKKKALENLVNLWVSGYNATPREKGTTIIKDRRNEREKKASEAQRNKLSRKRK
jgi:hypothetical protein